MGNSILYFDIDIDCKCHKHKILQRKAKIKGFVMFMLIFWRRCFDKGQVFKRQDKGISRPTSSYCL